MFGNKKYSSRSGIFSVNNKILTEIGDKPSILSINNVIEILGLPLNYVKTIHSTESDLLLCLGCKVFTKEIIFVIVKDPSIKISYSQVMHSIKRIDWDFEYSCFEVEEILQEGIEQKNFDFKFLNSVLDLNEDGKNIYRSDKFGLYLFFENEILTAFSSSGWENLSTKWLNKSLVDDLISEAKIYQGSEVEVMEEVNQQTSSFMNIPGAIKNQYIPIHTKTNGNVNYYNLMVTHYEQECMIKDFKFMNKGRYNELTNSTIQVGKYLYNFGSDGNLNEIFESNN